MIGEAFTAVAKLLKLQKDAKKTDLEIERLEREKARDRQEQVIRVASLKEIQAFDPRTRANMVAAEAVLINLLPHRETHRKGRRIGAGRLLLSQGAIGFLMGTLLVWWFAPPWQWSVGLVLLCTGLLLVAGRLATAALSRRGSRGRG